MLEIEKKPERNIQINFRIRNDLKAKLEKACKVINCKKGYIGQRLLEDFLEKNFRD